MKRINLIFASLFFALAVISCKKEEKSNENIKTDSLVSKKEVEQEFHKEWYGIYTGEFNTKRNSREYDNGIEEYKRISVKINRITKDSVYGYSVVNGNQRPFQGILNENTLGFVLDEPGNDKSDGRFQLKLKQDSLIGDWIAFNKSSVKSPEKTLKLTRKEFAYNPNFMLSKDNSEENDYENPVDWNDGKAKKNTYVNNEGETQISELTFYRSASDSVFKINASKQKLTEKDLKNLRKLDLQIIRNTVFARHGYSFKKETYRSFFENADWYVPVSNNVDADLTPLEKENVALLARFEKYAEDHYDTFGR
ncbi:YARHG domain-containing protein [Chryseobacterium sp. KACC 21268]|nr:YARHG domain-containing protein [Chryseobacterium sp. KACC 21268]